MHGGWVGGCDVQYVNVQYVRPDFGGVSCADSWPLSELGKKNAECRSKIPMMQSVVCVEYSSILRFAHASKEDSSSLTKLTCAI